MNYWASLLNCLSSPAFFSVLSKWQSLWSHLNVRQLIVMSLFKAIQCLPISLKGKIPDFFNHFKVPAWFACLLLSGSHLLLLSPLLTPLNCNYVTVYQTSHVHSSHWDFLSYLFSFPFSFPLLPSPPFSSPSLSLSSLPPPPSPLLSSLLFSSVVHLYISSL